MAPPTSPTHWGLEDGQSTAGIADAARDIDGVTHARAAAPDHAAMGHETEGGDGDGQAAEGAGIGLAAGEAGVRGSSKVPGEKKGAQGEQAAGVEDPAVGEVVCSGVKAEGEDVAVEFAGVSLEGGGKELTRVRVAILGLGGRRDDGAQAMGEQDGLGQLADVFDGDQHGSNIL